MLYEGGCSAALTAITRVARTERSQKLRALESYPLRHVTVSLSSLCPRSTANGAIWNAAQIPLEQLGCRWQGKLKVISSSPSAILNSEGAKRKTFPIQRKKGQGKRDSQNSDSSWTKICAESELPTRSRESWD